MKQITLIASILGAMVAAPVFSADTDTNYSNLSNAEKQWAGVDQPIKSQFAEAASEYASKEQILGEIREFAKQMDDSLTSKIKLHRPSNKTIKMSVAIAENTREMTFTTSRTKESENTFRWHLGFSDTKGNLSPGHIEVTTKKYSDNAEFCLHSFDFTYFGENSSLIDGCFYVDLSEGQHDILKTDSLTFSVDVM